MIIPEKLVRLGKRKSPAKVEILSCAPVILVQLIIELSDSWSDIVTTFPATAAVGKLERHPSGDPEKLKPGIG